MKKKIGLGAILVLTASAHAVIINVGNEGFVQPGNNWPGGEPPSAAIDGQGQKYLNFGKANTGVVVTPGTAGSVATKMTLWAANDEEPRDPASYLLFGTNSSLPAGSFDSSLFTLISSGPLALPLSRNGGGATALDPANSSSVSFANADAYDTYMILFPTLKNESGANSMQVAEIQLFDAGDTGIFSPSDSILGVQAASAIPEPSTALLAMIGLGAILKRRRK